MSLVRVENPVSGQRRQISRALAAALVSSRQAIATLTVDGALCGIRLMEQEDRRRESERGYDQVDRYFVEEAKSLPLLMPRKLKVTKKDRDELAARRGR